MDSLVRRGSEVNRTVLRQRGIKLIHGDVRAVSDLESVPRCDWIIDAAANPSVVAGVTGQTSSRQLLEHNLIGTINLLELARGWQSGFLMLSTSRVYSVRQLSDLPVKTDGIRFTPAEAASQIPGFSAQGVAELFSTEPPLSLYGSSKRASEILVCEFAEAFHLPAFIDRCGVLAGAGQFGKADQGIFSFWIHAWREGRPLQYLGFSGTGCQVRDCLHPRDLLPLIGKQLQASSVSSPRILNVSGGLSLSASLRQLSQWCEQRFGPRQVEAESQARRFDVPWLVLDSTPARKAWSWGPAMSLETIWSEIADHAERHPDWLDQVADG